MPINLNEAIKARIELPCSIRYWSDGLQYTRGVTEELTRETLVVTTLSAFPVERLNPSTHIAVAVELPHSREFKPRLLECAATVSVVRHLDSGMRISAKVNRMSIRDRESEPRMSRRAEAGR